MLRTPEDTTERLRTLHEAYVLLVNEAVAANRYRLAEELAVEYDAAALRLMEEGAGPRSAPSASGERRRVRRSPRTALSGRLRVALRGRQAA